MIDNVLVVEGVAHQYNFSADNFVDPHVGPLIGETLYRLHRKTGGPAYTLERETYMNGAGADRIGRAILAESQSDMIVYHETPIYAQFYDGGSALSVGEEMRRMWPERTLIYGAVSPLRPGAVERVDELIDEHQVTALKLYPIDLVEGRVTGLDMGDPEVCFPVFQRAIDRGLSVVAIHKALPVGPGPVDALRSADVEAAAAAFPQLTFEVVHGGMAFVEETAVQIEAFPNIMINLEATSNLLRYAPRRFAEAIGMFLERGGADRLIWATGCNAVHPRPVIEAFWDFEMPRDLVEEHGYPEITPQIKAAVLSGNFLRMHDIDETELRARLAGDEFDTDVLAPAWGGELDPVVA